MATKPRQVAFRAKETFRIVASRYPTSNLYDRLSLDPEDTSEILPIEAETNRRIAETYAPRYKVRAQDLPAHIDVAVLASFAYSMPGRFTDGSFGVYSAGFDEDTAIAESRYHHARFLQLSHAPPETFIKRMYGASISGRYRDLRPLSNRTVVYDRTNYGASQRLGTTLYAQNILDGIVYRSVRRAAGECACVFRPRCVQDARVQKYFAYRWDGEKISAVAEISRIIA